MADLLVDTDVFVDHLRGAVAFEPRAHHISYSVITRAELFAASSATDAVSRLLAPFRELPVDRAVAERAGRIRREHRIGIADALIAATTLQNGLGLVTRNGKHFETVRGLRVRTIR